MPCHPCSLTALSGRVTLSHGKERGTGGRGQQQSLKEAQTFVWKPVANASGPAAPVAPSAIVEAIQATGRDAILRGSGASDSSKFLPEGRWDGTYHRPAANCARPGIESSRIEMNLAYSTSLPDVTSLSLLTWHLFRRCCGKHPRNLYE